ncbi:ferric reductase-like transmembrane domain-containing protein [Actinosynnema sp. NPDC020468]|uniref:ferric reductase-like transmembrane domain-containing protein n=1 Tax=Actinosynnema sp. NPDC020468 TaxID=3154488 RepID=UPI0033D4E8E5
MTQALWFASRGTGLVSMLLFTAVVVLGVLTRGGAASRRWPRFAVAGLHRYVSLLALGFLVVHIATATIDDYAGIRWVDAVVPFGSAYRPVALGLGAVAFDLLLAVILTSLVRARMSYRAWRAVHWLGYAFWPVALVHGLLVGDLDLVYVVVLDGVCLLAVAAAVAWRVDLRQKEEVAA